jgi:hypothetical protein
VEARLIQTGFLHKGTERHFSLFWITANRAVSCKILACYWLTNLRFLTPMSTQLHACTAVVRRHRRESDWVTQRGSERPCYRAVTVRPANGNPWCQLKR